MGQCRLLRRLVSTDVRSERELAVYTMRIAALAATVAILFDAGIQAVLFVSVADFLQSLATAGLIAVAVTVPIMSTVGRAHLDLYRAKMEVEQLSRTDPLTGLANRRAFMEAVFTSDLPTTAMMIADIDRFKSINDTYGHLAGDAVIRQVAARLRAELGDLGIVGRLGGEEFALIATGVGPEVLHERMRRLMLRISGYEIRIGTGAAVTVTISVGIAFGAPGRTVEQVYAEADRALYVAKASGRNRLYFFGEADRFPPIVGGGPEDVAWVEPATVPADGPGAAAA